jgi:hypothetical protein
MNYLRNNLMPETTLWEDICDQIIGADSGYRMALHRWVGKAIHPSEQSKPPDIWLCIDGADDSSSISLTPDQARCLAEQLLAAASRIEDGWGMS